MRSPFSVTRRHIEFLFNREETVVSTWSDVVSDIWINGMPEVRVMPDDTELQLPPSDESKVGQD